MQVGTIVAHQISKSSESETSSRLHQQPSQIQPHPHLNSFSSNHDLSMSNIQTPIHNQTSQSFSYQNQNPMNSTTLNSINIRKLVQQSQNYWKAERAFFSDEKKEPSENIELEKLMRSIQNVLPEANREEAYLPDDHNIPNAEITSDNFNDNIQLIHSDTKSISSINSKTQSSKNNFSLNCFSQNKKLQDIQFSFSLAKKGIGELGKYSFQLSSSSLEILDLSLNKFRDIPVEIFKIETLKVLKMDNNYIKKIDALLFTCLKLDYFSISNNLLSEISEFIIHWKSSLKFLDVSQNRIDDLEVLTKLNQLQSLHIHNNDFRTIPTSFHTSLNSNIKELSLDWFLYTQPPLEISQSGFQGSKIIKKLSKYLQDQQKNSIASINFMDTVKFLSGNQSQYDLEQVDQKDHGRYLSHKAALKEEIGCLISLLENKYSLINVIDNDGHSPLSLSILHEKYLSAKTLISNGADVNIGGALFGNCLNLASIKRQYFLALDLLKRGANPNSQDTEGNAPLHYMFTIFHKDPSSAKICDLLLKFRADPNLKNKDEWAPIHLLSKKGTPDAIKFIAEYNTYLSRNNYQNFRLEDIVANQKILNSETPFKPFYLNLRGGKQKQTPLHIACANSCYSVVTVLLQNGGEIFARDKSNKIALQLCMRDNFLYKMLKLKEAEVFNKFFHTQKQKYEVQIHNPQMESQNSLNSYAPNFKLFKASGNSNQFNIAVNSNQIDCFDTSTSSQKKNLNLAIPIGSQGLVPTTSSSSFNAQKLSFCKGQQDLQSSRPSITQQMLKGVDSVVSLDEWEENNQIDSDDQDLHVDQLQFSKLIQKQKQNEELLNSQNKFGHASPLQQISESRNTTSLENPQEEERGFIGQLGKNSLMLAKQRIKKGEEQYESLQFESDSSETEETDDKEEEFLNSEIDEAKSNLELFNRKQKIIYQQLAYAPNNIQQLNYVQAINRANLKKQGNGHNRSKSDMNPSKNKTSQKSNKQPNGNLQRGLIQNEGADVPIQVITPQHISFFQYLLEKTKNMYEYYSVSLQNYKKGILSEFNSLFEKFKNFIILLKLQIEFQNMVRYLHREKQYLSSLLGGESTLLGINFVNQNQINLMVMKMLLEVTLSLKCEKSSISQIQKDFPCPIMESIESSSQPNSNLAFWMRQYEDSIPELVLTNNIEEKFEIVEGVRGQMNEEEQNEQHIEEKHLNQRENGIIKECIIYQLGNYDFNEALEYLQQEVKSSETNSLNAFESCQSFFKIRQNLLYQKSSLNNNESRKGLMNLDFKNLADCDVEDSLFAALAPSQAKQMNPILGKHPSGNPTQQHESRPNSGKSQSSNQQNFSKNQQFQNVNSLRQQFSQQQQQPKAIQIQLLKKRLPSELTTNQSILTEKCENKKDINSQMDQSLSQLHLRSKKGSSFGQKQAFEQEEEDDEDNFNLLIPQDIQLDPQFNDDCVSLKSKSKSSQASRISNNQMVLPISQLKLLANDKDVMNNHSQFPFS